MSEAFQRITMTDVARRAGVHATTVSLALRNHPSLPESTRKRIQALAEKMGYQPDPALRALVAWRRQARPRKDGPPLAYLTHWDTRWGWKKTLAHGQFFSGALARAQRLGYRLEHFWLGEPLLTHRRMSSVLSARGITGVIVASHMAPFDGRLDLDWARFSAVRIDYLPHEPELHTVTNDQRAIMQLAVRRIVAAGYRRIGFVMPSWWDAGADRAWSAGFLAEQHTLPAEDCVPILEIPSFREDGTPAARPGAEVIGRAALGAWLEQHRPEVLIAHMPYVRRPLEQLGIAMPRDLAFVEIFLEPDGGQTAGVRHNCVRVGELAVEVLAGQLLQYAWGLPPFPTATLVEGTWFDGASLPVRRAAGGPALSEPGAEAEPPGAVAGT